jgi:hypothetical protein
MGTNLQAFNSKRTLIQLTDGRNCGTKHTVPRGLTERRLKALMDSVYLGRTTDSRSLGWLAANGYVDVVAGSVYCRLPFVPLVRAVRRQGFYYWAGSQEPALVTNEGKHLSGWAASAYIQALRTADFEFPEAWIDPVDVLIRQLRGEAA